MLALCKSSLSACSWLPILALPPRLVGNLDQQSPGFQQQFPCSQPQHQLMILSSCWRCSSILGMGPFVFYRLCKQYRSASLRHDGWATNDTSATERSEISYIIVAVLPQILDSEFDSPPTSISSASYNPSLSYQTPTDLVTVSYLPSGTQSLKTQDHTMSSIKPTDAATPINFSTLEFWHNEKCGKAKTSFP